METFEAMEKRRSIRKFRPEPVSVSALKQIIDISRLYPSGGNVQPVRFAVISQKNLCDAVFSDTKWAMYLPGYSLADDERPTAYIALLRDETVSKKCDYDMGAASTMIMLAATDLGLATCPIGNFHRGRLSELLKLPETLHPELLIALGYPAQESRVVPMGDSIRYCQDEQGDFLVPKWSGEELTVFFE